MNTAPMWLVYEDDDGDTVTRHFQPWQDVATAGVLVNDIGNELELVGWTTEAPDEKISDERAMALIHEILSGREWSADTAPAIAEVVALTGREIADIADGIEWDTHLWAVYDEHGECVGVDVAADSVSAALAQFSYANEKWRAQIQDAATAQSDYEDIGTTCGGCESFTYDTAGICDDCGAEKT